MKKNNRGVIETKSPTDQMVPTTIFYKMDQMDPMLC